MSRFWKVRLALSFWGFLCAFFFTGRFDLTSKIFLAQFTGNTVILWFLLRGEK